MKKINLNKIRINWKIKLAVLIVLLIALAVLINQAAKAVASWFDTHTIQWNQIISVTIKPPFEIKKREVPAEKVIEVVEKIPEPQDLKTDIEKYIYQKWGIENYKLAISIFTAESGLREDVWHINNNGTIDYGIAQINSVNWKLEGCSLKEIVFARGNLDCAYKLWDRANGIEGDGVGSFKAWSVARNGRFLDFLK